MTTTPLRGGRLSDYDYALPPESIAERPASRRDESRLLVLPRGGGTVGHRRFRDIVDLIAPGDLLVVNQSRVLPARLRGRKPTGAPAEVLLLHPRLEAPGDGASSSGRAVDAGGALAGVAEARVWEALVRPGSKLKPGRVVEVGADLRVEILGPAPGGGRVVRLDTPLPVAEALERYGHVPLPPYITRDDDESDRERYQTVYASTPGSIAAPTAGLHFTPELLADLESRGVRRTAISLHVGVGTFRPVEVDDPAEHTMHAELYHVPEAAARAVSETRSRGGRVWAVGTTVVRTVESVATAEGGIRAGSGSTDLFIRPPFDFRVVDGLITNFHLPRSTLLMLVSAFAGRPATLDAYETAVRRGYRFYSYGDAMVVTPANHLDGRTT
ncbi:MAG: tRNA preQ1(34) S-adenosylmethionine ribosyltransferase-isomerase QueA [Gemmatimonadetes bacterium]|nr:tRNA preQ1(34) S-adenosylmethionine ribosyltransferase-isomerase QueA [Gemmatimonadota bacterium]